jgi:Fur family transcriptional regulator, ferric uptake regulator
MVMQDNVERTLRILQDSGYRLTSPRRAVIEATQRLDRAFTAEELLNELSVSRSDVGRATVFRTLDVLVQNGVLDRIHRPDGCHSYVLSIPGTGHHHHLICSDCGAVVQFEECTVAPLLEALSERTNFQISDHWLEVFGRCGSCRD